jgi:hypothetical protein
MMSKGARWETIEFNNVNEIAMRYFYFEFPWVECDGRFIPRDGIIVWFPFSVYPSCFDLDWLLSPYTHPDSNAIINPRNAPRTPHS